MFFFCLNIQASCIPALPRPLHPDPFPPLCAYPHFLCVNVLILSILSLYNGSSHVFRVLGSLSALFCTDHAFLHAPTHPDPFPPLHAFSHSLCVNVLTLWIITRGNGSSQVWNKTKILKPWFKPRTHTQVNTCGREREGGKEEGNKGK